jgi:hypothetical protein
VPDYFDKTDTSDVPKLPPLPPPPPPAALLVASAQLRVKMQAPPAPPAALRYIPAAPQSAAEHMPENNYKAPAANDNATFYNLEENAEDAATAAAPSWDGVYPDKPRQFYQQPIRYKPLSRFLLFLYNFGASGLAISLSVHALLLVLAIFFIVSMSVTNLKQEFALPGGGGGNGGDAPRDTEHRVSLAKRRDQERVLNKIRVKGVSRIALPDAPPENKALVAALSNLRDASSGSGGGSGGGSGLGRGLGIGGGSGPGFGGGYGRAYVGRPLLGMRIQGSKIAVYLDNSQSLVPYLGIVKQLIYEQFPTADIFELPGVKTTIVENAILGGKHSAIGGSAADQFGKGSATRYSKLTQYGRELYKKYGPNFARGSVGAWVDILLYEQYDALIIFSDFQDGFHDDGWVTVAGAETWKTRWLAQFQKAKAVKKEAPKLYLVSVQLPPQQEWRECVEASGGEITLKDVHTKGAGILKKRER